MAKSKWCFVKTWVSPTRAWNFLAGNALGAASIGHEDGQFGASTKPVSTPKIASLPLPMTKTIFLLMVHSARRTWCFSLSAFGNFYLPKKSDSSKLVNMARTLYALTIIVSFLVMIFQISYLSVPLVKIHYIHLPLSTVYGVTAGAVLEP